MGEFGEAYYREIVDLRNSVRTPDDLHALLSRHVEEKDAEAFFFNLIDLDLKKVERIARAVGMSPEEFIELKTGSAAKNPEEMKTLMNKSFAFYPKPLQSGDSKSIV